MDTGLKVLVIDENPVRAAILLDGLREGGHMRVEWLRDTGNLSERVFALDPDLILIDLENPNRDVLEQMFQVSREVKRPIAMFVDHSDQSTIEQSINAGVSTYVVDGLKRERVKSIVDVTISRFKAFSSLKQELEEAKSALEERKIVDRAKGLLMKKNNISESEAYAILRKTAMNKGKKISDIASSLITASELLI